MAAAPPPALNSEFSWFKLMGRMLSLFPHKSPPVIYEAHIVFPNSSQRLHDDIPQTTSPSVFLATVL